MSAESNIRSCHVTKTSDEQFEFNLKDGEGGKGQIISSVVAKGPAARGGLKEGDKIITVNGVNVEEKSHADVVKMIKECVLKNEIKFEVVGEEHDSNTPSEPQASNKESNKQAATPKPSDLRPRICKIVKAGDTMGFKCETRQGSEGKMGHFISEITDGGPAAKSGLKTGDRVIEVGGTNVEKLKQAKFVSLIKKKGNKIILLVVDEATYKHFNAKKLKIKAKLAYDASKNAITSVKPAQEASKTSLSQTILEKASEGEKARLVHVIKGKEGGYGFSLQVQQGQAGEQLGQVSPGKPGERCGLIDGDTVLGINGKLIISMSHNEVIGLVKSVPNHVIFLVAGPKAVEHAKLNGLRATVSNVAERLLEKPKSVKLHKGSGGYGFSLKNEQESPMHIISDVASKSPAEKQGLKNGDVVACISGENVMQLDHDGCVKKIKDAGSSVELIVGTTETMKIFYDLGVHVEAEVLNKWPKEENFVLPDVTEHDQFFKDAVTTAAAVKKEIKNEMKKKVETKPRLCKLKKMNGGFGFFLRDDNSHVLVNVAKGGAADVAGVKENDAIIEVNGVNVAKMDHEGVVKLIRKSGKTVTFLVREQEDNSLQENEATSLATANNSLEEEKSPLPRFCELVKENNSFGFSLVEDENGAPGQYIRGVEDGGSGAKAGLLNDDRVIEVNGEKVQDKTHEEVVALVKSSGDKVNFLVVDKECDSFYKEKKIEITLALISATTAGDAQQDADTSLKEPASFEASEELVKDAIDEILEQADQEEIGMELKNEMQNKDVPEEETTDIAEEKKTEEQVKEDVKEAFAKEVTDDEDVEQVKEEIVQEIKEAVVDEVKEEIVEETKEEIEERIKQEMRQQIELEMRQKMEEEIKRKIEEEMRQKMEESLKPAISQPATIPEAPRFVGSVAPANAVRNFGVSRTSVKNSAAAFSSPPSPPKEENLIRARGSLKKIQRFEGAAKPSWSARNAKIDEEEPSKKPSWGARNPKINEEGPTNKPSWGARNPKINEEGPTNKPSWGTRDPKIDDEEPAEKPSFMSARAMFESGNNQPNRKPNWQRNLGGPAKTYPSYGKFS